MLVNLIDLALHSEPMRDRKPGNRGGGNEDGGSMILGIKKRIPLSGYLVMLLVVAHAVTTTPPNRRFKVARWPGAPPVLRPWAGYGRRRHSIQLEVAHVSSRQEADAEQPGRDVGGTGYNAFNIFPGDANGTNAWAELEAQESVDRRWRCERTVACRVLLATVGHSAYLATKALIGPCRP
jgi:hypothetical protein